MSSSVLRRRRETEENVSICGVCKIARIGELEPLKPIDMAFNAFFSNSKPDELTNLEHVAFFHPCCVFLIC